MIVIGVFLNMKKKEIIINYWRRLYVVTYDDRKYTVKFQIVERAEYNFYSVPQYSIVEYIV